MRIYVINLARRPDRLAKMDASLTALGLSYERIDAVDGADADINSPEQNLSDGAYACYLSHIKAYSAFLDTGDTHCVIMEDDVALSPRLPDALSESSFFTDQNAIARLERPPNYYWHDPCYNKPFAEVSHAGLATFRLLSYSMGTGAFVISRSVAGKIVKHQSTPELPIDVRLFHPKGAGHLGFKILQFSPSLAIQRLHYDGTDDSDIPFDRKRRHKKRHPLLQNFVMNYWEVVAWLARRVGCSRRFPFADK